VHAFGVPMKNVGPCIFTIGTLLGQEVDRSVDRRSVGRFLIEGGIAAKLQVGLEMASVKRQFPETRLCVRLFDTPDIDHTASQDSTTHRHPNIESTHCAYIAPDYSDPDLKPKAARVIRAIGVKNPINHSTAASVADWNDNLDEITRFTEACPLSERLGINFSKSGWFLNLQGMNGDHANNEKATAEQLKEQKIRELFLSLGEEKVKEMSPEEFTAYSRIEKGRMLNASGGFARFMAQSTEKQDEELREMDVAIGLQLGEEAFAALPIEDQRERTWFVWTGCDMHKALNAFKIGCAAMPGYWIAHRLTPPVTLGNKANAELLHRLLNPEESPTTALGDEQVQEIERTSRGGNKCIGLLGAIFCNKNENKGQGDSIISHAREWERKKGVKTDPSRLGAVSRSRFGSYGSAALEVAANVEFYQQEILFVKYRKNVPGWTNIELNVHRALSDKPTLTEINAMGLYSGGIDGPYMRMVRAPEGEINALDLGPLHDELKKFMLQLINSPGLMIDEDADEITGSLMSKGWSRPEAMAAIRNRHARGELPHLKGYLWLS
jgi:hypothetical protein